MTHDEQQKAIAELVAPKLFVIRKPKHDPFGYYRENAAGYTSSVSEAWKVTEEIGRKYQMYSDAAKGSEAWRDRVILEPVPAPDYTSDLNAMHEAEKTLSTDEQIEMYLENLTDVSGGDTPKGKASFTAYFATASQRAEAFMRTLGLWTP